MISLTKLKNVLGDKGQNMTDEEIRGLRNDLDKVADVIFDSWLEKVNSARYIEDYEDNVVVQNHEH